MITEAIRRLVDRQDLDRAEMQEVFAEVMGEHVTDGQKAALLVALRMKGETAEEIAGAALAMRERVTALDIDAGGLIDTCGTGGDARGTFNISTAAAIVAAAAGARVAKHGNRAVSSACGSADVLAELGVNIDLDAAQMTAVLRRAGIAFLFAPRLHPAMGAVAAVRRQLGVRTIFNILGPLTNPAFARRQVMGVYAAHLVEVVASVLLALGADHAMVVHSDDGLDELSLSAPTHIAEVEGGRVRSYRITAADLGLPAHALGSIAGGDALANAGIIRAVFEGKSSDAQRDIVIANAAAALRVSGLAGELRDAAMVARQAIADGRALAKLDELVAASKEVA